MYPRVYLKKGKEEFLHRKHPWIFSGALKNTSEKIHNQVVYVCIEEGKIAATAYYQNNNIAAKILDFSPVFIDQTFWNKKILNALLYRQALNLINGKDNAYRLLFAEADGLPGLIIDNYNGHFVMQAHNEFVHQQKHFIHQAIKNVFQENYISFYDKSEFANNDETNPVLIDTIIKENNFSFYVNWKEGQKTGFFLDQKNNRYALMQYAKNKVVLNTFAYSGGFSIYAAAGGAKEIHSLDSSEKAIQWCNTNMQLNRFTNSHQSYVADAFEFLRNIPEHYYDIIVLDPPAFAKSMHQKHNAIQAYKRLNALALKKIKHGGYLFTFSCSGVLDKYLFYNTIAAACFECNREIKILQYLHLPPDHPIIPNFAEGEYLKGMVLYVE